MPRTPGGGTSGAVGGSKALWGVLGSAARRVLPTPVTKAAHPSPSGRGRCRDGFPVCGWGQLQENWAYRLDELRSTYGPLLWDPPLPRRARIADAKGPKAPIHDYGYRAKDLIASYDSLSTRLLKLRKGH